MQIYTLQAIYCLPICCSLCETISLNFLTFFLFKSLLTMSLHCPCSQQFSLDVHKNPSVLLCLCDVALRTFYFTHALTPLTYTHIHTHTMYVHMHAHACKWVSAPPPSHHHPPPSSSKLWLPTRESIFHLTKAKQYVEICLSLTSVTMGCCV